MAKEPFGARNKAPTKAGKRPALSVQSLVALWVR